MWGKNLLSKSKISNFDSDDWLCWINFVYGALWFVNWTCIWLWKIEMLLVGLFFSKIYLFLYPMLIYFFLFYFILYITSIPCYWDRDRGSRDEYCSPVHSRSISRSSPHDERDYRRSPSPRENGRSSHAARDYAPNRTLSLRGNDLSPSRSRSQSYW